MKPHLAGLFIGAKSLLESFGWQLRLSSIYLIYIYFNRFKVI
jgi:hypothetical protein